MATPRKILILTNRIPYPLKDGGNMAMHAMIEGYHEAGWQVYLLSMNTSRHHVAQDHLAKMNKHLAGFEWVNVDTELKTKDIIKNFLFSKEPNHAQRFYNEAFKEKLEEVLAAFNPDVVQVESVFLSGYLPSIKSDSRALAVLRLHNVEYQIWQGLAKRTKNRIKRFYLNNLTRRVRNYERAAWLEYDLLLAITEKDAHLVSRLEMVNEMIVAPFSIDTKKIVFDTNNEKWVGYHLGAMDWMPNAEGMSWFLQKVWPRIHKAMPNFEFYFAGRGMSQQFKDKTIGGVHCLGEVPDAKAFIADKKILIVPLRSGGGVRVKILEAMASGKVVISTHTGMKGIDAKPGEHYLLAGKPDDYVRSIKWCLENKDKAEAMAQKAVTLVKTKYEQENVIKNVTEQIDLLLNTRSL